MASNVDRGLDDIIADSPYSGPRTQHGRDEHRRRDHGRQDNPRDGVRKQSVRYEPRSIDSEWVHDRYDECGFRRGPSPRRRRPSPPQPSNQRRGSKLRVDNIHYDLSESDLDELFTRIGPVLRLQLLYDRAGRSEGTAYVTYEYKEDAVEAIQQFHGANANGQPIRLTLMPSGPSRNPFDTAVMPSRPLAERITAPTMRSRSLSPHRAYGEDRTARKGIDRYIPNHDGRSRSPMPSRRGGRRPGTRREGLIKDEQGGRGGGGRGDNTRPKKTQELDAEMEDYFGASGASTQVPDVMPSNGNLRSSGDDDVDMIE